MLILTQLSSSYIDLWELFLKNIKILALNMFEPMYLNLLRAKLISHITH